MRRAAGSSVVLALVLACSASAAGPLPGEELAGGDTTVFDATHFAFSYHARNLDDDGESSFFVGNSFFKDNWVAAPASTEGRDGLGPLFNARSCSGCHAFDGRAAPPMGDEPALGLLVRLSVPGVAVDGGPMSEPTYGGQVQPLAIPDVPAEGDVTVSWVEQPGKYGDGTKYSLRRPTVELALLLGPLAPDTMLSPRVAPHMIGLGLLGAIDEADLLEFEDPDDDDDDGISGRANRPWDPITGAPALGRFGWKANQAGLFQQVTGAFVGDMGIASVLHPTQECSPAQTECADAVSGGVPELSDLIADRVTFYSATLAVPGRRDVDDPEVLDGRALFGTFGCDGCHVPDWITGRSEHTAALEGQHIWPYTDLLLHDMGEDLADGRPDYDATGSEWRTPPLWGLGLVETVNGHDTLLHDGRARGFAEAILWHGGEAKAAREEFRLASADERASLLRFLESL